MKYNGKLYGKIGNKYFDTSFTSENVDTLIRTNFSLSLENEYLQKKINTLVMMIENQLTFEDMVNDITYPSGD